MKIQRVFTNSRKKTFVIETKGEIFEFPFSQLDLKPSKNNPVVEVYTDPEIARTGFTYKLADGQEDSVLIEQVMYYSGDPEILRKHLLYKLSIEAQKELKKSGLTKRALSRRLKVTPTQLYRLLDHSFYGKTVDQMIKLLLALGREVEFSTKAA